MGNPTGFKTVPRETGGARPVEERRGDYREHTLPLSEERLRAQGSRCMDCGLPFCHGPHGCPLDNLIPEWNDRVYRGRWRDAWEALARTNNFPELTGRVCPAPCESACVLGINDAPVTIKQLELAIADRAWAEGWIQPRPPRLHTGKVVIVIGSGPAGLAAADQLNQAGHTVTVLERADRPGGLLRYGIPDFKLERQVLEKRLAILAAEGVELRTGVGLGSQLTLDDLRARADAVCLCLGATQARELRVPGRELSGVHLAMELLSQQNRRLAGLPIEGAPILAGGRRVVVIGGGDTGSDCVGTAIRQGARSVVQLELLPRPPEARSSSCPWPEWPQILRTSSSHEEGCERIWSVSTERLTASSDGRVAGLDATRVEWRAGADGRSSPHPVPGSELHLEAELVLLALGFVGMERELLPSAFAIDPSGSFRTSLPRVFAAGDARRGQSLVVWAIREGRHAARAIDLELMGDSALPE